MLPIDVFIVGLLLVWIGRHQQKQHGRWWGWVLIGLGMFIIIAISALIYWFSRTD